MTMRRAIMDPHACGFAAALPPKGEQIASRGSDASSRRGAPRRGDRRPMRVGTRGRLALPRFSSHVQGGRSPAARSWAPTLAEIHEKRRNRLRVGKLPFVERGEQRFARHLGYVQKLPIIELSPDMRQIVGNKNLDRLGR